MCVCLPARPSALFKNENPPSRERWELERAASIMKKPYKEVSHWQKTEKAACIEIQELCVFSSIHNAMISIPLTITSQRPNSSNAIQKQTSTTTPELHLSRGRCHYMSCFFGPCAIHVVWEGSFMVV